MQFTVSILNVGKSPAYDIVIRTGHLPGQWQVMGEDEIYAPGGEGFYDAATGEEGVRVSALMPGEDTRIASAASLAIENLGHSAPGPCYVLPRYAVLVSYSGPGIEGRGQTGKVFGFYDENNRIFDPTTGENIDGKKLTTSVVDRVRVAT